MMLGVAEDARRDVLSPLLRREYPCHGFLSQTRRVRVATSGGAVPALAFWGGTLCRPGCS